MTAISGAPDLARRARTSTALAAAPAFWRARDGRPQRPTSASRSAGRCRTGRAILLRRSGRLRRFEGRSGGRLDGPGLAGRAPPLRCAAGPDEGSALIRLFAARSCSAPRRGTTRWTVRVALLSSARSQLGASATTDHHVHGLGRRRCRDRNLQIPTPPARIKSVAGTTSIHAIDASHEVRDASALARARASLNSRPSLRHLQRTT